MSSRARIPIPRKELRDLCRRYQVERLALFGSVLRADFRPGSDVDVLVAFKPGARVTFLTLSRMQREFSELLQRHVDLVPIDGLKPVIRDQVLSNIEEIYAA